MNKRNIFAILCLFIFVLTGCHDKDMPNQVIITDENEYNYYNEQMDSETSLQFNGTMEEQDLDRDSNTEISSMPPKNTADEEMQQIALSHRIIADIPEMDLSLTYGRSNGYDYIDISLHYNGQTLPISGKTMADSMFMPSLVLFENNSKAAIILIETEGSGIYISSIHIVDLEEFHEISHEDAITYTTLQLYK